MTYNLSSAFTSEQRERASVLIEWGVREGWSTTALQTRLQREGLGFRRAVLIKDYEQAQVVSRALTPEARERAENFYEKVYKPFKEERGLTTKQMGGIMSAFKKEAEAPEGLQELLDDWGEWTEVTGT